MFIPDAAPLLEFTDKGLKSIGPAIAIGVGGFAPALAIGNLVGKAMEVYRALLAGEPGNERARARLAEIERTPSPEAAQAARRRAIERTIAGLEALLAVVQKR